MREAIDSSLERGNTPEQGFKTLAKLYTILCQKPGVHITVDPQTRISTLVSGSVVMTAYTLPQMLGGGSTTHAYTFQRGPQKYFAQKQLTEGKSQQCSYVSDISAETLQALTNKILETNQFPKKKGKAH